jgi:hypothetical protein
MDAREAEWLMRWWWHLGWAGFLVGTLLLNVFWPVYPNDDYYEVWAFSQIAYPVSAAVILANRPGNRTGRLLAFIAVMGGVIFVGGWVIATWEDRTWSLYLEATILSAAPAFFWGVIALLYFFPTGSIPQRFARRFFVFFTMGIAALTVAAAFVPGPLDLTNRDNPWGGPAWIAAVYDGGFAIIVPGVLVGIWSLLNRRKTADHVERSQMKWFLTGTVAVVAMVAVIGFGPELSDPWQLVLMGVVVAGFWALPAAIVVAITRYRLYEIDRIISRTVSYVLVVGSLAALFLLSVVWLQAVLPTGSSTLAVAGSTLAVAALFNPLRRRVLRIVDRRFNRSRYDAAVVVARVIDGLRDSVEVEEIVSRTETVISEVFAPATLGTWVSGEK